MKQSPKIAGIILSGGASRRMGMPKALLDYQGETFLDRMIRLFQHVCDPVVVVLGKHADPIRAGIQRGDQAVFTVNPDPDRGMLSSLQCALAEISSTVDAVMFTPVDHPNLNHATLQVLVDTFALHKPKVVVPTYAGDHGHPVCISRELIAELQALPPTAQAADIIHRYVPETVYVPVEDAAVAKDIDDPASYAELIGRQSV